MATPQKPANLKNSYTRGNTTFDVIRKALAAHGAKSISFDYDADGRESAITFSIVVQGRRLHYHMPARVANVEKILARQFGWTELTPAHKARAFKTAWANVRDWITANLALVDSELVKTEEVLLPYMLVPGGQTLFYAMQEQQFLLPSPKAAKQASQDGIIEGEVLP
jgi:hypothetical protein